MPQAFQDTGTQGHDALYAVSRLNSRAADPGSFPAELAVRLCKVGKTSSRQTPKGRWPPAGRIPSDPGLGPPEADGAAIAFGNASRSGASG